METYIDDKKDASAQTRIEPAAARPERDVSARAESGPDAAPRPPVKKITVGGKEFDVLGHLRVASGEADLYLIQRENEKYVFKYYRYDIVPKTKVIEKIEKLSPEHVIRVIDYGTVPNGRFYEIQEFARYGSLEGYLASQRRPSEDFVMSYVREINMCLREIHANGVVHRDIKPANILIRTVEPLDLILTDFGISSIDDGTLRMTGRARTTVYSAPEALTGVVTRTLDFWGAGIVLLEMLAGRHPFSQMDEAAVMYSLTTRPVPFVSDVPERFRDLVKGLLTRDPQKRWGCDQVDSWLAGGRPAVYFEEQPQAAARKDRAAKTVPYRFAGAEYSDFAGLAAALARNPRDAMPEMRTKGFREYLARGIIDERAVSALDGVNGDLSMSEPERLSYFLLRAVPSFGFIFSGIPVSPAAVIDACRRVIAREADEPTARALIALTAGGVLARYLSADGSRDPEREALGRIVETCAGLPHSLIVSPSLCALAVVAGTSREFAAALANQAREYWRDRIVTKAVHPFTDAAGTEKAVAGLSSSREFTPAELACLAQPPAEASVSRADYQAIASRALERHENYLRILAPYQDALAKVDPGALATIKAAASGEAAFGRENYASLVSASRSIDRAADEARRFIAACEDQAEKERSRESAAAVEHTSTMIIGESISIFVMYLLFAFTGAMLAIVFMLGGAELGTAIGGPGSDAARFMALVGRVITVVGTIVLTNYSHNLLVFFVPIIILYNLIGPIPGVALGAAIGASLLLVLRRNYEFMRSTLMTWPEYWNLFRNHWWRF